MEVHMRREGCARWPDGLAEADCGAGVFPDNETTNITHQSTCPRCIGVAISRCTQEIAQYEGRRRALREVLNEVLNAR